MGQVGWRCQSRDDLYHLGEACHPIVHYQVADVAVPQRIDRPIDDNFSV